MSFAVTSFQRVHNSRDGRCKLFVLPDTDRDPAGVVEGGIGKAITLGVSSQLRTPILRVLGRRSAVFGAGVPEAPVNKDSYSPSREYDIRSHATCGQVQAKILPETQADGVKCASQSHFRLRTGSAYGAHVACTTGCRRRRTGWHPHALSLVHVALRANAREGIE